MLGDGHERRNRPRRPSPPASPRRPSITPATGAVFDVLEEALAPLGFTVHRFIVGEAPDGPVENLFASRGSGAPHFAFAGHLDVVPPGRRLPGPPIRSCPRFAAASSMAAAWST